VIGAGSPVHLLSSSGTQSLDYYLGEFQETFTGPVTSLISGLLLLFFCLKYLKGSCALKFGFIVFLYLLVTKFFILFEPPYGESITALFSDTIWLYRHKLDYLALLKQETFTTGGPQIYPTSLYPYFLSFIMTIFPTIKASFVFMHFQTFVFASIIIALLREMILRVIEDEEIAFLGAILLLSLPLFQSMVELINMEIPCVFFAVLAVYFIIKKKIVLGGLSSVFSLLIKAPGAIVCACVFISGIFLYFSEEKQDRKTRYLLTGFVVLCIAVVKIILRGILIGKQEDYNKVSLFGGCRFVFASIWFWVFLSIMVYLILKWFISLKKLEGNKFNIFISARDNFAVLVMILMSGLWFGIYLNFSAILYRYQLLLFPFLLFCAVYALSKVIRNVNALKIILMGFIIFGLINSHGLIYLRDKKLPQPSYLERSLEYRNYLKLEKKYAKEIEKNFSHLKIGAPFEAAQVLSYRELGYVKKDLDVFIYGMKAIMGIKPFIGLKTIDINKTLWVGFKHDQVFPEIQFPIGDKDLIIKKIEVGERNVYLFLGGFAIDRMRLLVNYYLKKKGLINKN